MSTTTPPPTIGLDDYERAWRLVAASWEHDGALFEAVVAEAAAVDGGAVGLLSALARNLVVRLRTLLGDEAFDRLIGDELRACAEEKAR